MKSMRNEIKHIMRAVAILTAVFAMTFVSAGSASAVVIGPVGNSTVVHAPIGAVVSPFGVREEFFRPQVNPFFRQQVNPFFRPAFNPFFRPAFNPFFKPRVNPFFRDDDLDDFGLGVRFGIGEDD